MASTEEVERLARVIDETELADSVRMGIARRMADVLQTRTKNFDRDKFVNDAIKTKRTIIRTY